MVAIAGKFENDFFSLFSRKCLEAIKENTRLILRIEAVDYPLAGQQKGHSFSHSCIPVNLSSCVVRQSCGIYVVALSVSWTVQVSFQLPSVDFDSRNPL